MKANKVFFDLYSTSGGKMPYKEYRKWYDRNNTVYIVLVDAKIYTKVERPIMFKEGLNCGCFIEHRPFDTPSQVESSAQKFIDQVGAKFVSPNEFKVIEGEMENQRVAKAFAVAEHMITQG